MVSSPRAITLCVISVLVVSIPRARYRVRSPRFTRRYAKSLRWRIGAEIRSRGAVRGAGR